MVMVVLDESVEEQLKAERRAKGLDGHDEVWDGVYHMSPLANNEHQWIISRLAGIFFITIDSPGLGQAFAGANVSDREDGWEKNYRVPDLAVFLEGNTAQDRESHWLGGPDFVVEVASPRDETREKLPFYGKVGVRELLLVDRDPWALGLYRNRGGVLVREGESGVDSGGVLEFEALPLAARLVAAEGGGRPRIEVARRGGGGRWLV
jgi:Uma2 family endonuclease